MSIYEREINAISYLKKLGKFSFVSKTCGIIEVYGDTMFSSYGGNFRSETLFYVINMRKRSIREVTTIGDLI